MYSFRIRRPARRLARPLFVYAMKKNSPLCGLVLLALAAIVHGLNLCYAALSQLVGQGAGSWLPTAKYLRPELTAAALLLAGAAAAIFLCALLRFFRGR